SVDIWNLAGHRVRTLQGNGVVAWDGSSDEGREVASGVYFLRLRTDDGEEKRRVAVVRGGRR
ncbi:MAG: T9SS type A sorting domain-containing protein, partial [bacterium]